jgi:hypothetical protein
MILSAQVCRLNEFYIFVQLSRVAYTRVMYSYRVAGVFSCHELLALYKSHYSLAGVFSCHELLALYKSHVLLQGCRCFQLSRVACFIQESYLQSWRCFQLSKSCLLYTRVILTVLQVFSAVKELLTLYKSHTYSLAGVFTCQRVACFIQVIYTFNLAGVFCCQELLIQELLMQQSCSCRWFQLSGVAYTITRVMYTYRVTGVFSCQEYIVIYLQSCRCFIDWFALHLWYLFVNVVSSLQVFCWSHLKGEK